MKNIVITLFFVILLAAPSVAFAAECPLCDAIEYGNILLAFLPLFVAARDGNLSEVKRLLDEGVNVNEKDENGATALLGAAAQGHSKVVKLLLDNDVDVNDKTTGWTALMLAAVGGHSEVVNHLLKKEANVDEKDENGLTALILAAARGHTEVMDLLADKGADMNAKNNNGWTAVMFLEAALAAEINVLNREEEKIKKLEDLINKFFENNNRRPK